MLINLIAWMLLVLLQLFYNIYIIDNDWNFQYLSAKIKNNAKFNCFRNSRGVFPQAIARVGSTRWLQTKVWLECGGGHFEARWGAGRRRLKKEPMWCFLNVGLEVKNMKCCFGQQIAPKEYFWMKISGTDAENHD